MHPDCVLERECGEILRKTTAKHVEAYKTKLTITDLENRVAELEKNNNKAYQLGLEEGMKMQRKALFDTLLESRQHLLDSLAPIGINEHRVRQFAEWYENQRDARVNPKQDMVTYKICKNIMALEDVLREVQNADVQLT